MKKRSKAIRLHDDEVINKIYLVRGQKVMLDEDLAMLYEVLTKRLNEQVQRNRIRFPKDFMFRLTSKELRNLKSQFATSSWGGRRKLPYAFTEHGVLMLSSVLNSKRAIDVNIKIMRVYIKMREMMITQKDVLLKLEQLEHNDISQDKQLEIIFNTLKELLTEPKPTRKMIGFRRNIEEAD